MIRLVTFLETDWKCAVGALGALGGIILWLVATASYIEYRFRLCGECTIFRTYTSACVACVQEIPIL